MVFRFGFARLHPLLQHAVSMDERQDVEVTIRPAENHLPADSLTLRVAPMRLRLATKSLVSLIVKLLTITCAQDQHQEEVVLLLVQCMPQLCTRSLVSLLARLLTITSACHDKSMCCC